MGGISNDRRASGQVTRQSFPGSQSNISCQSHPENLLPLFTGEAMLIIVLVVGVAQMPPSGDRENWVLQMGIEGLGYCGIGKTRTMIVLVNVESEPFAYRIEIVESESHCWSSKETSPETGFFSGGI